MRRRNNAPILNGTKPFDCLFGKAAGPLGGRRTKPNGRHRGFDVSDYDLLGIIIPLVGI